MAYRIACYIVATFTFFGLGYANPESDSMRFELQKGFIIVDAQVDGKPGTFILDSGAPGLVLNARRFASGNTERIKVIGTGGEASAQILPDKNFEWSLINLKNLDALSLDLSYLEKSLSREITGLIGLDLLNGYNLIIDYVSQSISLNRTKSKGFVRDDYLSLPLDMHEHMMLVQIEYRGKALNFGVDTGSRSNLISKDALRAFNTADVDVMSEIALIGADQKETLTRKILVSGLHAGGTSIAQTPFVEIDMSGMRTLNGIDIDGVLGHTFFADSRIFIDKKRKNLRVKKLDVEPLIATR